MVVTAGRPDDEADPGAGEHPRDEGRERDRRVHDHVLAEEHRSDEGQIAQARNVDRRELDAREAGERLADEAREPESEQGEGEPGGHLVGHEGLGQEGEEQGHADPRPHRGGDPEHGRAGHVGGREASDSPP